MVFGFSNPCFVVFDFTVSNGRLSSKREKNNLGEEKYKEIINYGKQETKPNSIEKWYATNVNHIDIMNDIDISIIMNSIKQHLFLLGGYSAPCTTQNTY